MIDARSLQAALAAWGNYGGKLDGAFGPKSKAARDEALTAAGVAIAGWPEERRMLALEQLVMARAGIDTGAIDGLMGPSTRFAFEQWQNRSRDATPTPAEVAHMPKTWPRQKDMEAFYGKPGTNHTRLVLPYTMRLAWDVSQTITTITINAKCAASAGRALSAALKHYGRDRIYELGLDLFGGCYANRPMRGGTQLSTHAYAAALDIDPEHNQLRWGRDRARMARPEYAAFLDCFAAEGWISLGRERNFDWQHLQAARL